VSRRSGHLPFGVALSVLLLVGCQQEKPTVEPMAVSAADTPVVSVDKDQSTTEADSPVRSRADGEPTGDSGKQGAPTGLGVGGEQGVKPLCVLHSGSCRGFPLTKIYVSLPQSFPAPLSFHWAGGGS
jgi:hypothetical protein